MHRCGNYLRMGSTQQLPGTRVAARQDRQRPITSMSQRALNPFFFFYCYAHKILKWMEINVRHKNGWAAWLSGLHPPTEERGE